MNSARSAGLGSVVLRICWQLLLLPGRFAFDPATVCSTLESR
jgi:hypothetical protein